MNTRPIQTEADYDKALAAIACHFEREPELGSPEADEFDRLALVIGEYESRRWSIEPQDSADPSVP